MLRQASGAANLAQVPWSISTAELSSFLFASAAIRNTPARAIVKDDVKSKRG